MNNSVIEQEIVQLNDSNNVVEQVNDKEIIEKLLDRLSDDGLNSLLNEIKDEQELRKLSVKRMEKLKFALKIEKNKLIRDINNIKDKMIKEIKEDEYSSAEETELKQKPKKKVNFRSKKVNK